MNIAPMIGAAMTTDRPIVAGRIAALPRDDGRVLEAAEGPESHLAENVEVQQRERGQREREGTGRAAACP